MTSFLYMSTKYDDLKYFVFKHMLVWIDVKNTIIYHGYVIIFKYCDIQIQ
jgi:hypothetical protein